MEVIIMRGVPGAGKSTWLSQNYPMAHVVSADHAFIQDGVYKFDPSRLTMAHGACLREFIEHMRQPTVKTVAVDNTNTTLWETAKYVDIAAAYGYSVKVVRMCTPASIAAARNIHGVSPEAVERMAARFEDALPWWREIRVGE